ncbi:hypothetical protein TNCV_222011 [Trichonephila clavipes]|nr:hypothetical protein TNCV_222011 [Trichonephila clavipes]
MEEPTRPSEERKLGRPSQMAFKGVRSSSQLEVKRDDMMCPANREKGCSLTTPRNRRRNSTTLALKKKYADQTLPRRFTPSPTRGRSPIRRYRSSSPYRRSSQSPGRRSEENSKRATFQGDCGQNELVLEDICRDSTAPDAWNLYATRDYTLKSHSLTRITVSGYQTRGDINSSRRQQTFALREKILLHRPWYPHIVTEK